MRKNFFRIYNIKKNTNKVNELIKLSRIEIFITISTYELSIDVHFNRRGNIAIGSGKPCLKYFYTN